MKRISLLVVGTLITVALAGIYRFNLTDDDIYIEQSDGQVVAYNIIDKKDVMLTLFATKTDNQWRISLPQSQVTVALTDIRPEGVFPAAIGKYRDGEEYGQVAVDYSKITPLNFAYSDDQMVFVAPFTVSNQGSGVFYYLGLFNLNTKQWSMKHLDSLFIGDRVIIESLAEDKRLDASSLVKVQYLDHGDEQSMAEPANKAVEQYIEVSAMSMTKSDN